MDAITSLNLEAFLEALSQLDELTQKELVENLNQIVQKYPQMQTLHEAAFDRLLENYDAQSRTKLLLTPPQETTLDSGSPTPELSKLIAQFRKQRATPSERADELLEWVAQLPETNLSLSDEAFDRSSIYK